MNKIEKTNRNWFERNPKKTLLGFLLLFIFGVSFFVEKIIAYKNSTYLSGITRYIRLRELSPSTARYYAPNSEQLEYSDSLPAKNYLCRTDENGFISPSKIYDDPDIVMVFLGGSTTECRFMDEKNRFPYLTGNLLTKETQLKVNSYNSGVMGSNTMHMIDILLNKVIPMKPNIVILMENINDLGTLLHEGTYWNNNPSRSLILKAGDFNYLTFLQKTKEYFFPNLYSIISRYFQFTIPIDEFDHKRQNNIVINNSFLLKEFQKNLQLFIDICKIREIIPVLMTQQNRMKQYPDAVIQKYFLSMVKQGITYENFKFIYDAFNESIREISKKNNLVCIDLAKTVPPEKEFISDIVHFTEAGSKTAAQIIHKNLLPVVTEIRPTNTLAR